jgi:anti-sigma B factor antagonist
MAEQADSVRMHGDAATRPARHRRSLKADSIHVPRAVVLTGEMDIATVKAFHDAIAPSLERGGTVVVDMTNLDFMDSSGVHALIEAARQLDGRGCLFLHGVHDPVQRLLDIVGIPAVENIHMIACEVDPFLIHA